MSPRGRIARSICGISLFAGVPALSSCTEPPAVGSSQAASMGETTPAAFQHALQPTAATPACSMVTGEEPRDPPSLRKPGYLDGLIDPVFHHRIVRITGEPGDPIPNVVWPGGGELRWHPTDPALRILVRDNEIGYWNPVDDELQVLLRLPGYSGFASDRARAIHRAMAVGSPSTPAILTANASPSPTILPRSRNFPIYRCRPARAT